MSAIPNLPHDVASPPGPSTRNRKAENGQIGSARDNGKAPESTAVPINREAGTNGTSNGRQFALLDSPLENFRRMRVIVIGAGYSGIYLGIRLPERIRNLDLVIYDKNEGVGGTWWENRYPGCACDIPCTSSLLSKSSKGLVSGGRETYIRPGKIICSNLKRALLTGQ